MFAVVLLYQIGLAKHTYCRAPQVVFCLGGDRSYLLEPFGDSIICCAIVNPIRYAEAGVLQSTVNGIIDDSATIKFSTPCT
jgi:hypothetical protein